MTRPLHQYQTFWPCDLDRDLWPTLWKTLTLIKTFEPYEIWCISCNKTFPSVPNILTLRSWPWPLTYILKTNNLILFVCLAKNFNLDHIFWTVRYRAFIFHMCIPCDKTLPWVPYLFELMTLTVTFGLHYKNFNLHHFWTVTDRAFIFHMCVPCDKTFPSVPNILTVWTLTYILNLVTLTFDLYFENFNIDHNFWTIRERSFVFNMCVPRDKTFTSVRNFLNLTMTVDQHFENK